MIRSQFDNLRTILCLGAHADDIEIGCGATLLALLARHPQLHVHWVVFSADGPRRSEAAAGARMFLLEAKTSEVRIEQFRDTLFPHQGESIKRVMQELAVNTKPDLIFTHRRDDAHQDHRTLADLTWCAFRNQLILEYEIPKYEGDLGHPNVFFQVDRPLGEQKIQRIMDAYPTQRDKHWFSEDTYWAMLRLRGLECHSPTHYAEGFYSRKLVF